MIRRAFSAIPSSQTFTDHLTKETKQMNQRKRRIRCYDDDDGEDVLKDGETLRCPLMLCDGADHKSFAAMHRLGPVGDAPRPGDLSVGSPGPFSLAVGRVFFGLSSGPTSDDQTPN
jgi:hypothetical protein